MRETVYEKRLHIGGAPGAVWHSGSRIRGWNDWPDDVVETLAYWNGTGKRLRFAPAPASGFECPDCRRAIDARGSTAAKFDGVLVCDDCMIDRVRLYGKRGRPETPLEEAKRWQRNLQAKLRKYRHNALTERVYVARLKTAGQAFLDAYSHATVSDEEGILAGVDPSAMRRLWAEAEEAAETFSLALQGRDA